MPDLPIHDPLTQALRNLPPAPHGLSRERLLFEAGRTAGRSQFVWVWKAMTGVFGFATLVLVIALTDHTGDRRNDIASVSKNSTPAPTAIVQPTSTPIPPDLDSFVIHIEELTTEAIAAAQTRRNILEIGIDGLPEDRLPAGITYRTREFTIQELTDGFADASVYANPHTSPLKK